MIRNLKALGLALACALAIGAAATTSASASGFVFGAEEDEITLTGSQTGEGDVITTTAGTVKCSTITYSGSMADNRFIEFEGEPSYSGCTAGFAGVTIDVNGCKYRLTANTEAGPPYKGKLDVVCPAGKDITVTASLFGTSKCVIHIPAQNGLGTVTFTDTGSGTTREIVVDMAITGVSYTHTGGTGFGACTGGSASNGTYEGAASMTAESEGGAHVGLAMNLVPTVTKMKAKPTTLDFIKHKVNGETTVEVENLYGVSKDIENVEIVDGNTSKEESHYEIVKDTCKGVILRLGKCQVTVKLLKKEGVGRWLFIQYSSGGWFATAHKIKIDIGS